MSQTLFTAKFGLNELRIEVANKSDLAFTDLQQDVPG